jgi:predicted GIY-YIG superfamily endonuclease
MASQELIVYILTSKKYPTRYYIGLTQDLERRIKEHNNGDSLYTKRYMPWELQIYITFKSKARAEEFEKYLKSGSGFAFLKRRFL